MDPERVKSFGCFPHRTLTKLSLSRSRSKSLASSNPNSPRTPKSPSLSTPRTSSTRSKEEIYRQVFSRFDNDNDGKISALELRSYFGSIGDYMSHEDAQAVVTDLDADGDNLIDFQDFLRLVMRKEGEDEDLKAAFEMYELEKGSGRITPRSLQNVLSKLGETKSYDQCVAMIEVYDTDGKGELHFHEFQQMMME